MTRFHPWRLLILAILLATPTLTLVGFGIHGLWESGQWQWMWWPLSACLALAFLLGWYWQRQQQLLRVDFTPPLHWTERDQQAWMLVKARATAADKLDAQTLTTVTFYVETAQNMALELARFYNPKATDPIGSVTIPEILAVVELAAHDLADMVDRYLPGGHLLTVNAWRRARQATEWYQTASNIGWLISSLFSPLNTSIRYAATQMGLNTPWQQLQRNLLVWFCSAYVHRLGTYLIDLNSGRLRIGARRYRELMEQAQGASPESADDGAEAVRSVTLTLLGQAKVGKSSLINALLGEQRAQTDVLRATMDITEYQLQPKGIPTRLRLFDTVGYGHSGPKEDQLKATQQAARQSDLIVLVLHARNPARQADVELLEALRKYFAANPDLKIPPVLGVLTHIDLLSPSLEWSPPYNWEKPQRVKEVQIDQALAALREQLGPYLIGVVPVCTAADKVYGVQEWLLPAVSDLLDQAHAVAFLRCLRGEVDTGKVRKVFYQLAAAGKEAVKIWWQAMK